MQTALWYAKGKEYDFFSKGDRNWVLLVLFPPRPPGGFKKKIHF